MTRKPSAQREPRSAVKERPNAAHKTLQQRRDIARASYSRKLLLDSVL